MSKKRLVLVWNKEEDPISQVIEIDDKKDSTRAVLDHLIHGWGWTPEQLSKRANNEEVHVFEIDEVLALMCAQTNLSIVGTMVLFRDDGEGSARIFTDLIPIHQNETAKQALIERASGPGLTEDITFKMPNELIARTYGWVGTPLLTEVVNVTEIVTTIIGFVLFIDNILANALSTFDLQRFWLEEPSGKFIKEFVWPEAVVQDFSAHIQALCEDHAIGAPCPLE